MYAPRLRVACLLLAGPLCAQNFRQSNGPLIMPSTVLEEVRIAPPLRLAEKPLARPLADLPAAVFGARKELQELQEWNDAKRLPTRIGIQRALSEPQRVELTSQTAPAAGEILAHAGGLLAAQAGKVVWGAGVRVEEGLRLRLHLSGVHLPAEARLWVYGSGGEMVGPFGSELRDPQGGLWTPSVFGPEIRLEVEVPRGATARFTVDRIAEILPSALQTSLIVAADQACFLDGQCIDRGRFPGVDLVRKAIAHLEFPSDRPGFVNVCTGGLLNDTDTRTAIPYLLTAHHCVETQGEAAGLEAFFDYVRAGCTGAAPSLARLPRVSGSSLVATGESSDFSLLRLSKLPAGRVLLGWSAVPVANGTRLYRLSNPVNEDPPPSVHPQIFAETQTDSTLQALGTLPRPRYLYARQIAGGMSGGSSGSPVVLANGQVVGQLLGAVGQEPAICDFQSAIVDGAFSSSFPSLRPFLDPTTTTPCKPGPDTLCLLSNRFRVRVSWQNQFNGTSGVGRPIPRSNVTGFFSFGDPSNVELLVKILDFGGQVKVFWGQLTNLRYNLEVTDTRTGQTQNYANTAGDCGGIDQDFANSVLPAPELKSPLAAAASCRASASTLCLHKGRFAIEVDWSNPGDGTSGKGGAAALSNVTGTFTFSDRSNVELMVKMIDFGDHVALFWGALTDLSYTLRVTDTNTGVVKTYHSTPGKLCGGLDNNAF